MVDLTKETVYVRLIDSLSDDEQKQVIKSYVEDIYIECNSDGTINDIADAITWSGEDIDEDPGYFLIFNKR